MGDFHVQKSINHRVLGMTDINKAVNTPKQEGTWERVFSERGKSAIRTRKPHKEEELDREVV
jgi:hypothetical protein